MEVVARAELSRRPCKNGCDRAAIRVLFMAGQQLVSSSPARYCAMCHARIIDSAYGWKVAANVGQGLVAHELGKEIRARKRAARAAV